LIGGKIFLIPILGGDSRSGISMEHPLSLLTFKPLLFFFGCRMVRGCSSRRSWGGCWGRGRGSCGRRLLRVSGGKTPFLFLGGFMLYNGYRCCNFWCWLNWDDCGRGLLRVSRGKALLFFLGRFRFYNGGSCHKYGYWLSDARCRILACGMAVCARNRGF
jgi:hypothetical protein